MQVWKKVLSLLLSFALLLSCLPTVFAADATEFSYDFSTFSGSSTQYAQETHDLGGGVTLDLKDCHINSQLRIYSSTTNNGVAIFKSQNVITSITMNVGNNADTLNVYASTDGGSWDLIQAVTVAKSYEDKTVSLPEASGYHQVKLDVVGTKQLRVKTVAMTLVAGAVVEPEEPVPEETTAPTEETTAPTEETTAPTEETTAPTEAPTEPAADGLLAAFTFGENGNASHVDGNTIGTAKTYTEGSYTLALTDCSSVYGPAYDAKGNSALKFGTSSKIGTLTFTVADDVDYIIVRVAKYKANTTKCTINGTTHVLTKNSNDGEYDEITVDTTETKTVTIATVSGACRMMMDSISYYAGESVPETPTEPTEPNGTPLTIPQAVEKANAMASGECSVTEYAVTGTITGVSHTTYGNMYIEDAEGNSILIYGLYSEDGSVRYDAMEVKPVEGDTITVWAVVGNYNGTPQLQAAKLKELIVGEHVQEPDDGTEFSITEAVEMGVAKGHNTYTTNKYKVTGFVSEIKSATYGNLYISDAAGNTLYVYGTYDADGTNRYDAMEVKPQVGDMITVYGIIGSYNDAAQMKNGWIVDRVPASAATLTTTATKTELLRGEEFTVTVSVSQAEAYSSAGFIPGFDTGVFTVVSSAPVAGAPGANLDGDHVGTLLMDPADVYTGDAFQYVLKVNEDAAFGTYQMSGEAVVKNGLRPHAVTLETASVTVVCDHANAGGWAEDDQKTHSKTCPDCSEVLTQEHTFDDEGWCDLCDCYKEYTIVFKNWDGTVLSEQKHTFYGWPEEPAETPTKPADETYTYEFVGWTPEIEDVSGDAEYTAVFEPVYIEYTVTFKDHDGTVLQTGTYHYGDPMMAEAPADYHDSEYVYRFSGWDKPITTVDGDATYTAQYSVLYLRGDFNEDGAVSDRDAIYLVRCTLGMAGFEMNQDGDMDGDGQVIDKDAAYLLRFVLFPSRYPLH